ncbi:MAG: hypothetical protein P8L44_05350 [Opitutales bacterium]|nr:hypothetical protein [Opitutales bacterium]
MDTESYFPEAINGEVGLMYWCRLRTKHFAVIPKESDILLGWHKLPS